MIVFLFSLLKYRVQSDFRFHLNIYFIIWNMCVPNMLGFHINDKAKIEQDFLKST